MFQPAIQLLYFIAGLFATRGQLNKPVYRLLSSWNFTLSACVPLDAGPPAPSNFATSASYSMPFFSATSFSAAWYSAGHMLSHTISADLPLTT